MYTDDALYLFVVNHPRRNKQVEIFHFEGEDTLVHLKTITHPLLHRYTWHINHQQIDEHCVCSSLCSIRLLV